MTEDEDHQPHLGTLSYSDLLIVTLTRHEKSLSSLIERLGKVSDQLAMVAQKMNAQKRRGRKRASP